MKTKAKRELPSTAVGRKRLLKLADMLQADARNKRGIQFDLGTWGNADKDNPLSCGTTACAMGLAVVSGAFVRAGLAPMRRDGDLIPRVGRAYGTDAAAKLFHITAGEADWLFLESGYPYSVPLTGAEGERAVAKRIRDFVAGKDAPR